MRALVEYLAQALVDNPDDVEVEEEEYDGRTIFHLYVADEDMGKVIGKQGRTVRSLRTIVSAAGMKMKKHFTPIFTVQSKRRGSTPG